MEPTSQFVTEEGCVAERRRPFLGLTGWETIVFELGDDPQTLSGCEDSPLADPMGK